MKKIIFLDSKTQAEKYLKVDSGYKADDLRDNLLIGMNPATYSYLKGRIDTAQDSGSYFTNGSHIKLLEKSKAIIDWARDNMEFVDLGLGIQRAYRDMLIFWLRFAVHNCLWIIEVVSNSLDAHNPETLVAAFSGGKRVSSLYLEPDEKNLGRLVRIIAEKRNLKFEDIASSVNSDGGVKASDSLNAVFKFILKYERFQWWERKIFLNNIFNKEKPVFFTTKMYQFERLAQELCEKYPEKRFYFLQGPILPKGTLPKFLMGLTCGKYLEHIRKQEEAFKAFSSIIEKEKELFSYRGISFAGIISKKINQNIGDYILELMLWSVRLNHFVESVMPSAFISNGVRADDVALAEICRLKSIPVILISHGSHVYPKNDSETIEWGEHGRMLLQAPFSHLALQTPVSEGYLGVFPTESSIVKTGPLIWGKPVDPEGSRLLFKRMFDGKYKFKQTNVIVHAGTPKPSKSLRFYVYETPEEYIGALCDLASAVEKIPNTILIIKFRPTFEIGVNDIKRLVPFSEKVILSVEEPFPGVLGIADLLVSFSSTTIEEALQNRVPVLLYGGGGRYQHIPGNELNGDTSIRPSALYHVREAKNLEYAINGILRLGINKNENNSGLFKPYIYAKDARTSIGDLLKA